MKYDVKRFKSLKMALKELEPIVRNGAHLRNGKPFDQFGGLRSREMLGNWLICAALNFDARHERLIFTSDPLGGDGILYESETDQSWQTEHVMVPPLKEDTPLSPDIVELITDAVQRKQEKGGAAYASGKTLIVFLDAGSKTPWYPNAAAKTLPPTDFDDVWVVGLQQVQEGAYSYGVSELDLTGGNAPTWIISIGADFESWNVVRLQ